MSALRFILGSHALTYCSISAVLNVPRSASQNEIRERYRALSVIFHPDKQSEPTTRDTASKKFLEIQKAYESESVLYARYCILSLTLCQPVLSDEFLR